MNFSAARLASFTYRVLLYYNYALHASEMLDLDLFSFFLLRTLFNPSYKLEPHR